MMILICLICKYIMLHQFISSSKLNICVEYLSRMKAAYNFFIFSIALKNSYHKHVFHNSRFSDYTHVLQGSVPCRVGLVVSVSASRTIGREFASLPGHTKDHHKNGTNCLPAWHAMR